MIVTRVCSFSSSTHVLSSVSLLLAFELMNQCSYHAPGQVSPEKPLLIWRTPGLSVLGRVLSSVKMNQQFKSVSQSLSAVSIMGQGAVFKFILIKYMSQLSSVSFNPYDDKL